jgi:uncharacterized protein YuzE
MEKIKGNTIFKYDHDADVLYCSINKPRPAKSIENGNGVIIRVDPFIDKIVGFTVIDYKKRKTSGKLKTIPYFETESLPNY